MLSKSKAPKSQNVQRKVLLNNQQHHPPQKKHKQESRGETGTAIQSDITNDGTGAGAVSVAMAVTESGEGSVIAIEIGIAAVAGTGDVIGRLTGVEEKTVLIVEAGVPSAVRTVMIGPEIRIGAGAETAEDITTTEGAVNLLVGAEAGIGKEGMTDDKNYQNWI